MGLDIAVFVIWLFAGLLTLIPKGLGISKVEYGLAWGVLMLQLFRNIILNL